MVLKKIEMGRIYTIDYNDDHSQGLIKGSEFRVYNTETRRVY